VNILTPIFGYDAIHRAQWKAQKRLLREQRRALRAQRHRGFFGRLFGLAWGFFWILFALSFAFGGSEYRHDVIDFVSGIGRWAAEVISAFIHGTWIQ
jgi:hypothetical protein